MGHDTSFHGDTTMCHIWHAIVKNKKKYIAWTEEEEKEEENSPQQRADITNCVCNNRLQR